MDWVSDICAMNIKLVVAIVSGLLYNSNGKAHAQGVVAGSSDTLRHVMRDSRIDLLLQAHITQNKNRVGIEGYRVQVYSGSGNEARKGANDVRKQIITSNPDLAAHLVYQPPNFKVRVGDCRTEVEAIRLKRELAYDFPQGFVVRDIIKLPHLSIEQQEPGMDANVLDAPVEIQTQSIDEGR